MSVTVVIKGLTGASLWGVLFTIWAGNGLLPTDTGI